MDDPQVSVVITNYNYGRYVREAVESALNQVGVSVEVIVVDDGSLDDSLAVLSAFGDRIVLITQQNAGQGGAFNTGIARARGRVVCLLDADDTMSAHRARRIHEEAEAHPDAGVFVHPVQRTDSLGQPLGAPWPSAIPSGSLAPLLDRSGGYWPSPPTSGLAFRSDTLARLLPIPPQDWRICADAYLVALAPYLTAVHAVNETLANYRLHGRNYWASGAADRPALASTLVERAQALRVRHQNASVHARRIGIPMRSDLSGHYQYQFLLAELGSLSALWRLALMALRPPPFVRTADAVRAPLGALRRLIRRRLATAPSEGADSHDSRNDS